MIRRFVLVGCLNSIVALVVFGALDALLNNYRLAAIIAVPICVVFSHATMGRLVFSQSGLRSLIPFALLYAVLGAINAVIISAVVYIGQLPIVGQILALPVIALLSFIINKNFVFRRRDEDSFDRNAVL